MWLDSCTVFEYCIVPSTESNRIESNQITFSFYVLYCVYYLYCNVCVVMYWLWWWFFFFSVVVVVVAVAMIDNDNNNYKDDTITNPDDYELRMILWIIRGCGVSGSNDNSIIIISSCSSSSNSRCCRNHWCVCGSTSILSVSASAVSSSSVTSSLGWHRWRNVWIGHPSNPLMHVVISNNAFSPALQYCYCCFRRLHSQSFRQHHYHHLQY